MDAGCTTSRRDSAPVSNYRPPTLVVYGSVAARTLATTTGSINDSMAGMAMM